MRETPARNETGMDRGQ